MRLSDFLEKVDATTEDERDVRFQDEQDFLIELQEWADLQDEKGGNPFDRYRQREMWR